MLGSDHEQIHMIVFFNAKRTRFHGSPSILLTGHEQARAVHSYYRYSAPFANPSSDRVHDYPDRFLIRHEREPASRIWKDLKDDPRAALAITAQGGCRWPRRRGPRLNGRTIEAGRSTSRPGRADQLHGPLEHGRGLQAFGRGAEVGTNGDVAAMGSAISLDVEARDRDREWTPLKVVGRVVAVGRIAVDLCHLQGACRGGFSSLPTATDGRNNSRSCRFGGGLINLWCAQRVFLLF
jgi:hypothetical protein